MDTKEVDWLPETAVVMNRAKAAAAAEVLLCAEPDMRLFKCRADWSDGMAMAQRHDGAGSWYFIVQSPDAIAIKVCKLHTSMGPDALARFQRNPTVALPAPALRVLNDESLRYQEMSFLAWSERGAPWTALSFQVDGFASQELGRQLLDPIAVGPKAYYVHARDYHEVTLDPTTLKAIFQLTPMDAALAEALAPGVKFRDVRDELKRIGYPLADGS